jgi:hypothetical protein
MTSSFPKAPHAAEEEIINIYICFDASARRLFPIFNMEVAQFSSPAVVSLNKPVSHQARIYFDQMAYPNSSN